MKACGVTVAMSQGKSWALTFAVDERDRIWYRFLRVARPLNLMNRARSLGLGLVLALVLVACGDAASSPQAASTTTNPPGTAGAVALQPGDLSGGVERCDYSADIAQYLENIRPLDEGTYTSIAGTWAKAQAAGATGGHIAVYAESTRVCGYWITRPPAGHDHGPMRLASSIVVRFADVATAEAVYRADLFGQSALDGSGGIVESGAATGLGTSSVVWFEKESDTAAAQAVWQSGPFNVFLTTRNLTRAEVHAAISAVNLRAGAVTP